MTNEGYLKPALNCTTRKKKKKMMDCVSKKDNNKTWDYY